MKKSRKFENALVIIVSLMFIGVMYLYISAFIHHYEVEIGRPDDSLTTGGTTPVTTPVTTVAAETTVAPKTIEYETPEEMDISEELMCGTTSVEESKYTYYDVPLDEDLQRYIFEQCEEKGVDPKLVLAMIYVESSFRPSAIGDKGNSFGLMQIQPRWHQKRMDKLGCTDLLDPYQNVTVGIDYIADLIGRKDSIEWALMAYNAGASTANKKAAAGEVTKYVTKVFEKMDKITEVRD